MTAHSSQRGNLSRGALGLSPSWGGLVVRSQLTKASPKSSIAAIHSSQEPVFTDQFWARTAGSDGWFNCIKSGMAAPAHASDSTNGAKKSSTLRQTALLALLASGDFFVFLGFAAGSLVGCVSSVETAVGAKTSSG